MTSSDKSGVSERPAQYAAVQQPLASTRPLISREKVDEIELRNLCPTRAIGINPVRIDLGKCAFCGACEAIFPNKIRFTGDHNVAANVRERLIVLEGEDNPIRIDATIVRKEIRLLPGHPLRLFRLASAGRPEKGVYDFELAGYGIEFLSSPSGCDGLVLTGPVSEDLAQTVQQFFHAAARPVLLILEGSDAITSEGDIGYEKSFLHRYPVDLYVPGNPPHLLTFVNGVLELLRKRN